jgi:hypothetical protein
MEEESSAAEQVILSPLAAAKSIDAQLMMPLSDWAAHVDEEAAKVVDSPLTSSSESTGGKVAKEAAAAKEAAVVKEAAAAKEAAVAKEAAAAKEAT